MKKIFFTLIFLIAVGSISAQEKSETKSIHKYFKISPFALFEPESALQFSIEYPLTKTTGLEHEFGLITSELFQNVLFNRNFFGVKTKHEYRMYRPGDNGNSFFYHGPQFTYKFVKNNITEDIWKQQYWEEVNYGVQRHVVALNYKIGVLQHSRSLPLTFDWFIGIGFRYHFIDKSEVPSEIGNDVLWFEQLFGMENNLYGVISPITGVKIGFLPSK